MISAIPALMNMLDETLRLVYDDGPLITYIFTLDIDGQIKHLNTVIQ